jgi:hypothetical protein
VGPTKGKTVVFNLRSVKELAVELPVVDRARIRATALGGL